MKSIKKECKHFWLSAQIVDDRENRKGKSLIYSVFKVEKLYCAKCKKIIDLNI